MVIRDLGELSGDVLLFGGPYSNLQASQALSERCAEIPRRNRICTGDVIAYCADPVATAERVFAETGCVVAGNCERQLAIKASECGCGFEDGTACDLLSRGWYPFANAQVSDTLRGQMRGLPQLRALYPRWTARRCHSWRCYRYRSLHLVHKRGRCL